MTEEQTKFLYSIADNIGTTGIEDFTCKDGEKMREIIKALEQPTSDDVMAIHTQGLAEGIRCAMCTNSMKSDKGCDGGCVVDNKMYKKVMETIKSQMFNQPTSDDCVSRQAVVEYIKSCGAELGHDCENEAVIEDILTLPPVTPTIPSSEDCVSRQAVLDKKVLIELPDGQSFYDIDPEDVKNIPPVTPTQCIAAVRFSKEDLREICNERIELECTHGTCKDCKNNRKNPYARKQYTCELGHRFKLRDCENFYCADFEKRGNSDGSN